MSKGQGGRSLDKPTTEIAILFAQDAFVSCMRLLQAGEDEREADADAAISAIGVAWDTAPPAERNKRSRPDTAAALEIMLTWPCGRWLPFADVLGLAEHAPLVDGRINESCLELAKEFSGG